MTLPFDPPPGTGPEAAGAILDAFGTHPEWAERERDTHFDRLVAHFPPEELIAAARERLDDLRGHRGEAVLRLVEAMGDRDVLRALADALAAQPDLPPERTWEALALLEGTGFIEDRPELAERRDDLVELMEDDGSLEGLVEHLEDDPEEVWVALQGLAAVEPEVRAEIVVGLARPTMGPGLIEFLRLLSFAHDPATRSAALDTLERAAGDEPALSEAWGRIAGDHHDPEVVARARRRLGSRADAAGGGRSIAVRQGPRLVGSLVTGIDGRGRGYVVLAARDREETTAAAYLCDVGRGVREVVGQVGLDGPSAAAFLAEFAARPDRDAVADVPELAVGLLAGSLLVCDAETPPALRYWLERTVGPGLQPRPFPGLSADWDPASLPPGEMPGRADAVLASCRDWEDDSDLTYDLAEEVLLRHGGVPPDPDRDSGAYRYLFEHRLQGRLESYRRMLFWMGWFWHASGDLNLGRSALALAWQLSDPQHAVPGHPFAVALTTRSLASAGENLRRGIDPRRPGAGDS